MGGRGKADDSKRIVKIESGKETVKSDFQSSVNVYDFQGTNYRAKSLRGARGGRPATGIDHITLRLIKFKRC